MSRNSGRLPRDDDAGHPGGPIQDPLLKILPAGADREPPKIELRKKEPTGQADTGGPAAGRMSLDEAKRRDPFGWLQILGPGLITGASDDDPSGIGTYSQVGSQFGYSLLWMSLFTLP